MKVSVPKREYTREREVKWGRQTVILIETFRDGPEEREKQKRALEILRDAPTPSSKPDSK